MNQELKFMSIIDTIKTEPQPTTILKSKTFIVCGGTLIALSAFLFTFCLILSANDGFSSLYIQCIACGIHHVVHGSFILLGGSNLEKYHCSIVFSLVLGIIGCAAFIIPLLILDMQTWVHVIKTCNEGCTSYKATCNLCDSVITGRFLPIFMILLFIGIISIELSYDICNKLCTCVCCCCYTGYSNYGVVSNHNQSPFAHGSRARGLSLSANQIQTQFRSYYPASPLTAYATWQKSQHQQQLNEQQIYQDDLSALEEIHEQNKL